MDKTELLASIEGTHDEWFDVVDRLGVSGLERDDLLDAWRVRDVLAHCNCWDRWQLVQLRTAFTGDTPTDAELHGPITFPPNDDMSEDAMNAMFLAGYADWPTDDVVAHFRDVCEMRRSWVAGASQEMLDQIIVQDWAGGTQRIFRLQTEVPGAINPMPAWQTIMNQIGHMRTHLAEAQAANAST